MKKSLYAIAALAVALLSQTSLEARSKVHADSIKVTPVRVEQVGDSVYVDLNVAFHEEKLRSSQAVDIYPVLTAEGERLVLPRLTVMSNRMWAEHERQIALMTPDELKEYRYYNAPYIYVNEENLDVFTMTYSETVPYEEWMRYSELCCEFDLCGCGKIVDERTEYIADMGHEIRYKTPYVKYVQPAYEEIKRREMVGESYLTFVVDKVDIRPDYMDNRNELARIHELIDGVKDDKGVTIRKISVIGFASPEGRYERNKWLSENRAKAMCDYIMEQYDMTEDMFAVEFGGENWDGLVQILDTAVNFPWRDRMLEIIATEYKSIETKKNVMKSVEDTSPYIYMLKNWYPGLRKSICKIDYEVQNFDLIDAREVVKKAPQNLSLNEMYIVANSYEMGSPEFIELFETAIKYFPEDETANLNAANAALMKGDVEAAKGYLAKAGDAPEAVNARGVIEALEGRYDSARTLFEMALAGDVEEAQKNIDQLDD